MALFVHPFLAGPVGWQIVRIRIKTSQSSSWHAICRYVPTSKKGEARREFRCAGSCGARPSDGGCFRAGMREVVPKTDDDEAKLGFVLKAFEEKDPFEREVGPGINKPVQDSACCVRSPCMRMLFKQWCGWHSAQMKKS